MRSWKLDETIPETYARYGASHLLEGEEAERGRQTLEHAHRMLPASIRIKIDLARLYAKLGRREDARALALVVATWHHDREDAERLDDLLADVGGE